MSSLIVKNKILWLSQRVNLPKSFNLDLIVRTTCTFYVPCWRIFSKVATTIQPIPWSIVELPPWFGSTLLCHFCIVQVDPFLPINEPILYEFETRRLCQYLQSYDTETLVPLNGMDKPRQDHPPNSLPQDLTLLESKFGVANSVDKPAART